MRETPPELVEQARELATSFGLAAMTEPAPALVMDAVVRSGAELRMMFPHLDDVTLMLFAHYISKLAGGLMDTARQDGDLYSAQAYLHLANGYSYLTAYLGQSVLAAS